MAYIKLCVILLPLSFSGCGGNGDIESAKTVTIYALYPYDLFDHKLYPDAPRLDGFVVLGEKTITDETLPRMLQSALNRSIGTGVGAKCFWPRHAIKADDKIYMLCFECNWLDVTDEERKELTDESKEVFDRIWLEQGLPLHQKSYSEEWDRYKQVESSTSD